jgi:hypothetical protein
MNLKNHTIPNFISQDDINFLENVIKTSSYKLLDNTYKPDSPTAWYEYFEPEGEKQILDLLLPKLKEALHTEIKINDIHTLTSFIPYQIHSDVASGGNQDFDDFDPAWTIIIPLDNYDSYTIVFNEESFETKNPYEWMNDKIPKDTNLTDFFKQYLDHNNLILANYLSIDTMFKWDAGSLNASKRSQFHASDNFIKNGITEKRAIIMWTTIPKTNYEK